MKKLILAAIALTSAASVYAQGTVTFNTRVAGTGSSWVYAGGDHQIQDTNTAAFAGLSLIGTTGNVLTAAGTFAQLLGANGAGIPESSLLPGAGIATFRTGGAAGNVSPTTSTFANVPLDAAVGTFEMVAWDNRTGLYPTWTQASAAWAQGLIAAGRSGTFTINAIGGVVNTPPNIVPFVPSFNIFSVPEPTTAALAGLGAAALLIFRRRK